MPSNQQNSSVTDSSSRLRDVVGNDATAEFEDDTRFVASNPTGGASSENLGAATDVDEDDEDEDVDEDDLVDDDLVDEDDEEYEDEDEDEDEDEVIDEDDEVDEDDAA